MHKIVFYMDFHSHFCLVIYQKGCYTSISLEMNMDVNITYCSMIKT
jgi:hypothetical protein